MVGLPDHVWQQVDCPKCGRSALLSTGRGVFECRGCGPGLSYGAYKQLLAGESVELVTETESEIHSADIGEGVWQKETEKEEDQVGNSRTLYLEEGGPVEETIHSAEGSPNTWQKEILPFRTAREIVESTPVEVDWVAQPWVATGAVTELDGKVKSSGKTTFSLALCKAVVTGLPFMEQPTQRTGVVFLSEQPASSFQQALRRADLGNEDSFRVLLYHYVNHIPWPKLISLVVEDCQANGVGLLVVDTLPQFAGLRGDEENNAGDALEAMEPLQLAAAQAGLGVLFTRHERKGGGPAGESGRGSSAFAGAADIVLALRRPDGNDRPTIRQIESLSRFEETPPLQMIEWTGSGYISLGDKRGYASREAREALLDHLPLSKESAMTLEALVKATGLPRGTLQAELSKLASRGEADQTGKGVKGDPYRFWAVVVEMPEGQVA